MVWWNLFGTLAHAQVTAEGPPEAAWAVRAFAGLGAATSGLAYEFALEVERRRPDTGLVLGGRAALAYDGELFGRSNGLVVLEPTVGWSPGGRVRPFAGAGLGFGAVNRFESGGLFGGDPTSEWAPVATLSVFGGVFAEAGPVQLALGARGRGHTAGAASATLGLGVGGWF